MIYTAIPAIMADLKAVSKDEKNVQQGWKFRGIDAVMNAMKPLLSKHEVFTVPRVLEKEYQIIPNANGKPQNYCRMSVEITYFAADGSSVSTVTVGEAMDFGDKASGKAMSYAYKYSLFELFCIPTEEMADPDREVFGDEKQPAFAAVTPQKVERVTAPVKVTATPVGNTPASYIKSPMAERGMDKAVFETFRTSVVASGMVKNIPSKDMTIEDAVKLCGAIAQVM